MGYEVVLLRRAQTDFDAILNWLSINSPAALERWFDSYEKILERLEREPLSFGYAPENEILASSVRHALFRSGRNSVYRLLFLIADNQVRVLRIRGPGQDFVHVEG
jgi:plasmid stabilization system protein ParE